MERRRIRPPGRGDPKGGASRGTGHRLDRRGPSAGKKRRLYRAVPFRRVKPAGDCQHRDPPHAGGGPGNAGRRPEKGGRTGGRVRGFGGGPHRHADLPGLGHHFRAGNGPALLAGEPSVEHRLGRVRPLLLGHLLFRHDGPAGQPGACLRQRRRYHPGNDRKRLCPQFRGRQRFQKQGPFPAAGGGLGRPGDLPEIPGQGVCPGAFRAPSPLEPLVFGKPDAPKRLALLGLQPL